jgi:hypothetical protein
MFDAYLWGIGLAFGEFFMTRGMRKCTEKCAVVLKTAGGVRLKSSI